MPGRSTANSLLTLRGYASVEVTSDKAAYALSERTFSRLDRFSFETPDNSRMTSSGPRHDGWSTLLVSSTGHDITLGDEHRVSILFPYRGVIEVQHGRYVEQARPSQALIVGPGVRTTKLSRNYLGVLVQVPIKQMERMDEEAGQTASALVAQKPLHQLRAGRVIVNAHRIVERIERSAFAHHQTEHWVTLLAPLWRSLVRADDVAASKVALPQSMRTLQQAEAIIEKEFTNAISLSFVSRSAGSSDRSLQNIFRLHRRSTPTAYIAEQRLCAARESLLCGGDGDTVTSIANAAGYSHLGRFAQRYRDMFGESPSQTLKRVTQRG